ncbi:hypothetical protein ACI78Q_00215 [Geodermatophilus sp. SYSU D00705]
MDPGLLTQRHSGNDPPYAHEDHRREPAGGDVLGIGQPHERNMRVSLLSTPRVTIFAAPSSMRGPAHSWGFHLMRSRLSVLAVLAVGLLAGCGTDSEAAAPTAVPSPAASESAADVWVGPSGLELESEEAARGALEAARAEAERVAAEAAARAAAEAAAQQAAAAAAAREAAEAAAQRAAEEAEQQAVIEAEGGCPSGWYFDDYLGCTQVDAGIGDSYVDGDDGYVSSDLEVRCSDGTATVEECFGPGSDLNGNGIADINE